MATKKTKKKTAVSSKANVATSKKKKPVGSRVVSKKKAVAKATSKKKSVKKLEKKPTAAKSSKKLSKVAKVTKKTTASALKKTQKTVAKTSLEKKVKASGRKLADVSVKKVTKKAQKTPSKTVAKTTALERLTKDLEGMKLALKTETEGVKAKLQKEVTESKPTELTQEEENLQPERLEGQLDKRKARLVEKYIRTGKEWSSFSSILEESAVEYRMSHCYHAQMAIKHKNLGLGYVISVGHNKMQVCFAEGNKNLIMNYDSK